MANRHHNTFQAELAYPGFVGTQILKGSTQIYVSSKYLQSQFPNSQLALPWLNNSREPSHQAELPKKGSIDLKEHFGLYRRPRY